MNTICKFIYPLAFVSLLTPALAEESAQKALNLNQPTRYAFITDIQEAKLGVFDALEQKSLATLDLKTVAEVIGISKQGGYVAYAKRGGKQLYRLDLTSQEQRTIPTTHPIKDFVVHEDGKWLAYTSDTGTALLNLKTGKETPIDVSGLASLLFHPNGESLFVAALSQGRLLQIQLSDLSVKTLLDRGKEMSPISVMPNGMALFFIAEGKLQRYSLLDEALQTLDIPASNYRPYMTSDSRTILALSDRQPIELLSINAYTYAIRARYALNDWQLAERNKDFMMTGWLEQLAVLADDNNLYHVNLQPDEKAHKVSFAHGDFVRDMLVQSDSKTMLLTREKSPFLSVFDLRSQKMNDVRLDLPQPDQVVMGETNTFCH